MEQEVDSVDMRSEREVGKGEEVFNSYGKGIGDARLLVEWGFMEGEFAGHGIEWMIDEVIPSDLGARGADRKAVNEVWEGIISRGAVALELYPDDEPDEDGEKLICPPITSSSDEYILNLNHNGQISLNIWIGLFLTSHPSTSTSTTTERIEAQVINSVNVLEVANISPKPTLDAVTSAACRKVVALLKSRLERMYRPEIPMEALLDMRDVRLLGICFLRRGDS